LKQFLGCAFVAAAICLPGQAVLGLQTPDQEYEAVAEEFIKGYFAARPLLATSMGLHEFDGKISDYSRLALDAELSRLKRFEDRLQKFELSKLSQRQSIDLRILQAAIREEVFQREAMSIYERNPMVYARAADVNIYIKRNFAPLEDRVHSIVAIESQVPNILIAARTNLDPVLPKPYVELAIQISKGSADFLRKNLVEAVADIKDERIRSDFLEANRKAAQALTDYAAWLERDKLPKATADFALGEEKFARMLKETELVDLPPETILEIGLDQLRKEQKAFVDAARRIDPNKTPKEIFKQIQNEHPTPESLLADVNKDLESIRKFVVTRKLVTIPSEVRARLKETPQYRRATSFASMDTPGAFEKRAAEAYYYVTPPENEWPPFGVVLVMRDNGSHSRYRHALAGCYIRCTADNLQGLRTHIDVTKPQFVRRRMATYSQDLANDILIIASSQLSRALDLQPEYREPLGQLLERYFDRDIILEPV